MFDKQELSSPPTDTDTPSQTPADVALPALPSSLESIASPSEVPPSSESIQAEEKSSLAPAEEARLRRKAKIQQLWWNRLKEVARFVLFIGVAWGIYVGLRLPMWFITPSQMTVQGHHMIQPDRVRHLLKQEQGKHLLLMNPSHIAQHLQKQDPLIARVQVRRLLLPKPHLLLAISEYRPWGLVYNTWEKPRVMAWHRQAKHKPETLIPPPFAFVLDSYKSLHFKTNQYQIPQKALTTYYTPLFMDTQWYRSLAPDARQRLLENLDRLIEGLRQLPHVKVDGLSLSGRQFIAIDTTIQGNTVLVLVGSLDDEMFNRLGRLKAILPTLAKLNKEAPKNKVDRIDLRWSENVYLHRQNGQTNANSVYSVL
jgi:cell division septal protein FtsQ